MKEWKKKFALFLRHQVNFVCLFVVLTFVSHSQWLEGRNGQTVTTVSNRRKILAVTTQLKQLRKESLKLKKIQT